MFYVLGAQKNSLIEMVLLSTYNICFGWEIRKLFLVTHLVWLYFLWGHKLEFNKHGYHVWVWLDKLTVST